MNSALETLYRKCLYIEKGSDDDYSEDIDEDEDFTGDDEDDDDEDDEDLSDVLDLENLSEEDDEEMECIKIKFFSL